MLNTRALLNHPSVQKLDQEIGSIFTNAPHLPQKAVDVLVKIAPYMILLSGIFLVTGGLQSIFASSNFHLVFDMWHGVPRFYFYLIGALQVVSGVFSIMAYKPLKARSLEGWQIMFLLNGLSLLMNLISIIFLRTGLFGLLLSLLLSLYFLYELKPAYLPKKSITKIAKVTKK